MHTIVTTAFDPRCSGLTPTVRVGVRDPSADQTALGVLWPGLPDAVLWADLPGQWPANYQVAIPPHGERDLALLAAAAWLAVPHAQRIAALLQGGAEVALRRLAQFTTDRATFASTWRGTATYWTLFALEAAVRDEDLPLGDKASLLWGYVGQTPTFARDLASWVDYAQVEELAVLEESTVDVHAGIATVQTRVVVCPSFWVRFAPSAVVQEGGGLVVVTTDPSINLAAICGGEVDTAGGYACVRLDRVPQRKRPTPLRPVAARCGRGVTGQRAA